MPSIVALICTLLFCAAMLWHVSRRDSVDGSLWLPVVWIFFIGSKFPSQWLAEFGLGSGRATRMEDGNPLDAAFFLLLIVAGAVVLARRQLSLPALVRENAWLALFFVYCFLAILWSDFPFVAFKRWIKVLGHPVMALVILTDPAPTRALRVVLTRAAVLMLPFSILFIKYYPDLGRGFDEWTGQAYNSGIHHNKNELGYTAMVFGLFFFWSLRASRRIAVLKERRIELALNGLFLWMVWWIFTMADSATSLVCVLLGVATMALVGTRLVSRRFIGTQLVVALMMAAAIETTFGVYAQTLELLGRDPTLTDRTEVWADVLAIDINPLLGAGFESFWLGWRLEKLWAKWWWQPNQAHSGYIETYLNLGWVGVILLVGMVVSTFRKCRAELLRDVDFGGFRLAVLFAVLAYNYTEATFKGVHLVWTLFHLVAIDYRTAARADAADTREEHEARPLPRRRWPGAIAPREPAWSRVSRG